MKSLLQVPIDYLPGAYVQQVEAYSRIGISPERLIPIAFDYFTRLTPQHPEYSEVDSLFRALYHEVRYQKPDLTHHETARLCHSLMDHIQTMESTLIQWLDGFLGRFDHTVRFEGQMSTGLLFSFDATSHEQTPKTLPTPRSSGS